MTVTVTNQSIYTTIVVGIDTLTPTLKFAPTVPKSQIIREIKIHVYAKRQT